MNKITKIEEIYPLTIIKDRYNGSYSGGKYLAFNLPFWKAPSDISEDDVTCMNFWHSKKSKLFVVGKGSTIENACKDLTQILNEKEG